MNRICKIMPALALVAAGCGGSTAAGSAQTGSTAARPVAARGSANVIIAEEIAGAGVADALQAVRLLRPAMLRGRSGSGNDQSGSADIVVYLDGVKSGGPQSLDQVTAISIREIRFLNAADATTRYGTGHPMGAILVSTKR